MRSGGLCCQGKEGQKDHAIPSQLSHPPSPASSNRSLRSAIYCSSVSPGQDLVAGAGGGAGGSWTRETEIPRGCQPFSEKLSCHLHQAGQGAQHKSRKGLNQGQLL